MRLLIMGPQGVGKGTQAALLAEHYGIPAISTGYIFRYNIKNKTELGLEALKYTDKGELVPDELTNKIVKDRLAMDDAKNGWILDGYPRNASQVKALHAMLEELGTPLDKVVALDADHDVLMQRIAKRAQEQGRSDDTPEAIILSGFDPVRREIARLALHQLVTDGRIHPARIEEVVAKVQKQIEEEIVEVGKRTTIDLGIHGLHPELIRMIGKMKYRSSYGQNLLQHARETANLAGIMAAELGLNPKTARRAGLLHDIGKVPDDEPELPHAIIGMKLAEKYKEKPEVCNAIGAHHDEVEMTSLIAPIIQVCDAISGARPGARREVVESYIKRLKEMEDIALSYPGVVKTYAIQAGRELRVIVGADKLSDQESEGLSHDIAKKIQDEMTYPGQVKITVIRETRAVSYAK